MLPLVLAMLGIASSSLLLAIALYAAFLRFGRQRHAIIWSVAFMLFTMDHVLMAFRVWGTGWHPINTLVATLGSLSGTSLVALGFWERSGVDKWRPIMGALAITAVASTVLILAYPANPVHHPLVTSFVVGMLYVSIMALRKGTERELSAGRLTLAMMGLFMVFFAFLTVLGFLTTPWGSLGPNPYRAFYVLGVPTCLTGIGLFSLFLLAEDLAHDMRQLVVIDPLTGLLNRRGFEEAARRLKAQCQRHDMPLCVAVADLDHFKSINDRFGHKAGDLVLIEFARRLQVCLREGDLISRSGGEEFVMLLPGVGAGDALVLLNRVREKAQSMDHGLAGADLPMPTTSIGVAEIRPAEHLAHSIERADDALYRAKRDGRNCVRLAAD